MRRSELDDLSRNVHVTTRVKHLLLKVELGRNRFPSISRITLIYVTVFCGLGSVVGIATGYGLDGPGIEFRWGARFSAPVQTGPGAHPASCTMGTGSSPGLERPGRDVDPSPPSSAMIMKR